VHKIWLSGLLKTNIRSGHQALVCNSTGKRIVRGESVDMCLLHVSPEAWLIVCWSLGEGGGPGRHRFQGSRALSVSGDRPLSDIGRYSCAIHCPAFHCSVVCTRLQPSTAHSPQLPHPPNTLLHDNLLDAHVSGLHQMLVLVWIVIFDEGDVRLLTRRHFG